jgi:hypothetical protein
MDFRTKIIGANNNCHTPDLKGMVGTNPKHLIGEIRGHKIQALFSITIVWMRDIWYSMSEILSSTILIKIYASSPGF